MYTDSMDIIITGKDFDLTPSLKTFVEEHAQKLLRFEPLLEKVKFELDVDRHHQKGDNCRVEAWAHVKGDILAAGGRAEEMHTAIIKVVRTLGRELERRKEKRLDRRKGS